MSDDRRRTAPLAFEPIDEAFRMGDLVRLRAALGDESRIPNGPMPAAIGSCLVYAIYHSPVAFIRTLLELGAEPNRPVDDGFPPLIAALSAAQQAPGTSPRRDVDDIVRLLLTFGATPDVRGINDYTALHMAVAVRRPFAVQLLLDAGADPGLRTRIDACETPEEMALAAGLAEIADLLARRGRPLGRLLRSGLTLLGDYSGDGPPVQRQHDYRIRVRLQLQGGATVRWPPNAGGTPEDEDTFRITRVNRGHLLTGVFYALDGMCVGGTRRVEIAPFLGYAGRGVPGLIPPNAHLVAEITVLQAASGDGDA